MNPLNSIRYRYRYRFIFIWSGGSGGYPTKIIKLADRPKLEKKKKKKKKKKGKLHVKPYSLRVVTK
jgi:hypothetical protein